MMKQTIVISAFAEALARKSGYTAEFCEHFVNEMFKTIAESLKEKEFVTIKGLGRFSADVNGNVNFEPEQSFSSEINAPFDCFEPEPLNDDVTDDVLLSEDEVVMCSTCQNPMTEKAGIDDNSLAEAVNANENLELESNINENNDSCSDHVEIKETATEIHEESIDSCLHNIQNNDIIENEVEDETSQSEPTNEDDVIKPELNGGTSTPELTEDRKRRPIWAFISGIAVGAIIGSALTYFIIIRSPLKQSTTEIVTSEQTVAEDLGEVNTPKIISDEADIVSNDSVVSAPVNETDIANEDPDNLQQGPQVVYDTVKTTLAQMSRKHFGRYEFWVYIYDENRDIISNPDRVEPNTRLRIPSAEKYGIDAKNKVSVNNALKRASEIANERK